VTSVGKLRQHVNNMLILSCLVYDFHMLSWLSDRSRTPDMITLPCWSHAVVTFRQKSYTRHDNINESDGSMWTTCWYYHISCTTSVGKSRQHVTNMLMLSCLVYDFCRKVTTACDQHGNVTRDMITLTCWSHAVVTFRQKSYTRHDNITMLVTCCRNFPTEVVHETW
jgi:uncharacterized C2H2 Zn-finger protein